MDTMASPPDLRRSPATTVESSGPKTPEAEIPQQLPPRSSHPMKPEVSAFDHTALPQPTFYPQDHHPTPFGAVASRDGLHPTTGQSYLHVPPAPTYLTPDQDPQGSRGVPIFHPTMAEFADFEAYASRLEPWGLHYGVVKVVPPREWRDALPPITAEQLRRIKIKKPIEQNLFGRAGLFRATNVEKSKTFTFRSWVEHCAKPGMKAPSPEEIMAMSKRTDRAAASTAGHVKASKRRKLDLPAAATEKGEPVQEVEVPPVASAALDAAALASNAPVSPRRVLPPRSARSASSVTSPSRSGADVFALQQQQATTGNGTGGNAAAAAASGRRKRPTLPDTEDDPWYDTFNVETDCYPSGTSAEDYTPAVCRELTRKVWRERGLGDPPWYGADLEGTLFDPSVKTWNTEGLPSLLTRLNLKRSLPGVNTSYLYFGSYRATFAWHVEDCYLGSINYIHFGAPKLWQSIPAAKAHAFERFMASAFDKDSQKCRNFLAHKSCLASPTNLAKDGIQGNAVVQHAGEFILTYPGGYHSGFNAGVNAASSCNFALDSWPEYGRRWKPCMCRDDTVRIDVDAILHESADRDREQRQRAEGQSSKRRRVAMNAVDGVGGDESTEPRIKSLPRRRRVAENFNTTSAVKVEAEVPAPPPKPIGRPCILCSGQSSGDLLPLHQPSTSMVKLAGKPVPTAHELCVRAIPETWLNDDDEVMGCDDIHKSRWSLPCIICRDKKGAKVQCVAASCVRSFHVTCAQQDERTQFSESETKQWILNEDWREGEPANQRYKRVPTAAFEILCWQHSPQYKEEQRRKKHDAFTQRLDKLFAGDLIDVRVQGGSLRTPLLHRYDDDELVAVGGLRIDGPPLIIRWKDILDLRDENAVSDDSTSTTARAQVPRAKVALGTAVLTPEMISLMSRDRVCHASLKRAGLVPVA